MKVTQKKQETQPEERTGPEWAGLGCTGRLQGLQAVVIDAVSTCTPFGRRRHHAKTHSTCVLHWQILVRSDQDPLTHHIWLLNRLYTEPSITGGSNQLELRIESHLKS